MPANGEAMDHTFRGIATLSGTKENGCWVMSISAVYIPVAQAKELTLLHYIVIFTMSAL